jgi:hypothetical protein
MLALQEAVVAKKGRARRFREARELKQGFDDGLFSETDKTLADKDDDAPEAKWDDDERDPTWDEDDPLYDPRDEPRPA